MEELSAIGEVTVENGELTVTLTVPAEFAEDMTQEDLDQGVGDAYISATLNEDGSITYKMTKDQYSAMLDNLAETIDTSLQELLDSGDYSFTSIERNADFTQFDVTLTGTELSMSDAFSAIVFYTCGGIYGVFTGREVDMDDIVINFYDASGNLLESTNSEALGNESSAEK